MQEEKTEDTTSKSLLLISGSKGSKEEDKEYVKKIANAILSCISKHGEANLRCVGAASENNAIKGIIIAKRDNSKLVITPSFTTVEFNGEEKTGMILRVFETKDLDKKGNIKYEDALLKVKGSHEDRETDTLYVKKLSNAILSCISKNGVALLRYVGAASGNNAIKAASIAKGEASKRGESLLIDPRFTTIEFNGEEKTGIILEVISV
jgi:stage V sporulation protein SpoVS